MSTVYISPTGDDTTGDGSLGNPWLSVSKALASTIANDIIVALAGTYTTASWSDLLIISSARIIQGAGANLTIFDAGGVTRTWTIQAAVTVKDMTFTDAKGAFFASMFEMDTASCDLGFQNCVFDGVSGGSTSAIIGRTGTLAGNGGSATINFCLFRNCNLSGTVRNILGASNQGTVSFEMTNCTVYTNTADASTASVVGRNNAGGSNGVLTGLFRNNIIFNENGTNKSWYLDTDLDSYTGSENNLVRGYSNVPTMTNTISTDPLFVDSANGNFNLRPTSPAIGNGIIT